MSTNGQQDQHQAVSIHVDAAKQTVTFKQKASQFSIKADSVTLPIIAIESLYVQLVSASLRARGVQVGTQDNAAPQSRATA